MVHVWRSASKTGDAKTPKSKRSLTLPEARVLVAATTLHGNVPEPLRLAHIIAGGVATGWSRGRA